MSNNIYATIESLRGAIFIQKLKTITSDPLSEVEDPRYV
jgi:hypothetical protein